MRLLVDQCKGQSPEYAWSTRRKYVPVGSGCGHPWPQTVDQAYSGDWPSNRLVSAYQDDGE